MRLEIKNDSKLIKDGNLIPVKEVWLDGKRAPLGFERIVLVGFQVLGQRYLEELNEVMGGK